MQEKVIYISKTYIKLARVHVVSKKYENWATNKFVSLKLILTKDYSILTTIFFKKGKTLIKNYSKNY